MFVDRDDRVVTPFKQTRNEVLSYESGRAGNNDLVAPRHARIKAPFDEISAMERHE